MPTPLREHAAPDFTGRGVTVAFLDSGFAPHPDLTRSKSRILAYVDVTGENVDLASDGERFRWQGTMSAVVAAGNGFLSGGLYRSLASESNVVLVRVGNDLEEGLRWVLFNRERHQIRVVSLGPESGFSPEAEQLAHDLFQAGVVLVTPYDDELEAPASVLTVGGYLDHHQPDDEGIDLYAHRDGMDAVERVKPELISPAAYVAAPMLAGTPRERRSDAVFRLARADERSLPRLVENMRSQAELPSWLAGLSVDEIRSVLVQISEQEKFVSPHYQHIDGASFGAPIVASVVAQMLQANAGLAPTTVRQILLSTAQRISRAPGLRQGYGMVSPREAVELALGYSGGPSASGELCPRVEGSDLVFSFANEHAHHVHLAGDFNSWDYRRSPFVRLRPSLWRCRVDVPPPGPVRYKIVVDGHWMPDPSNLRKDADTYGGMNSVVWVT